MQRTIYIAEMFFLNPVLFFEKLFGRILLKVRSSPKGSIPVKVGRHTILTFPSRNDWWKSMYLGYCDVEITRNIKRHLAMGGIFIDVGAGVGYFSAIASDIVGVSGQVHCFEPHPSNANAIQKTIKYNSDSNIILNDSALGIDDCVHNYYLHRSTGRTENSMVDGVIEDPDEVIEVKTERLDGYLEQKKIDKVSLIKIDVEGYEYYVLKGLCGFFEKTSHKPPIICEIFLPAYRTSGFSLDELDAYMKHYGYQAYNIFNPNRLIDIRTMRKVTDVIFRCQ